MVTVLSTASPWIWRFCANLNLHWKFGISSHGRTLRMTHLLKTCLKMNLILSFYFCAWMDDMSFDYLQHMIRSQRLKWIEPKSSNYISCAETLTNTDVYLGSKAWCNICRCGKLMKKNINLALCCTHWAGHWIVRPMGVPFYTTWKIGRLVEVVFVVIF